MSPTQTTGTPKLLGSSLDEITRIEALAAVARGEIFEMHAGPGGARLFHELAAVRHRLEVLVLDLRQAAREGPTNEECRAIVADKWAGGYRGDS